MMLTIYNYYLWTNSAQKSGRCVGLASQFPEGQKFPSETRWRIPKNHWGELDELLHTNHWEFAKNYIYTYIYKLKNKSTAIHPF